MEAPSPARKTHVHEIHEKAGSIMRTFGLQWHVRDDMKWFLSTKPGCGQTAHLCSVELSGCAPLLLGATLEISSRHTSQIALKCGKGGEGGLGGGHVRASLKIMNTASKLGPHTQTDRGTCPGVGL